MPETQDIKYIVALLAQDPSYFVNFAQQNFSTIQQGYILGPDTLAPYSKPHITIVQFYGKMDDYQAVKQLIQNSNLEFQPRFIGLNFTNQIDNQNVWVDLTVERDTELLQIHNKLVDLLERQSVKPLNYCKEQYRPHLTLALIKSQKASCPLPIPPTVKFKLVIGKADHLGQLIEVIYTNL